MIGYLFTMAGVVWLAIKIREKFFPDNEQTDTLLHGIKYEYKGQLYEVLSIHENSVYLYDNETHKIFRASLKGE